MTDRNGEFDGECAACHWRGAVKNYKGVALCLRGPERCYRRRVSVYPGVKASGGRGEPPAKRRGR